MQHTLFDSIEQMIAPQALSVLTNLEIRNVSCSPFDTHGRSATNADFRAVHTNDGIGPRFVIKRMSLEWDWLMHTTNDHSGRSTTIWQHGLLDRIPPEIDHTVIACAKDRDSWAILMHDVSESLLPDATRISKEHYAAVLDAMAAMHAAFWQDPGLQNPALSLCQPADLFSCSAAAKSRRVLEIVGPSGALNFFLSGWEHLPTCMDAELAGLLRSLADDPTPLCKALDAYPITLVHGDLRPANIGIHRGKRPGVVFLDFARPSPTAPAVDLAWLLGMSLDELPFSKEDAIAIYKQRLADRLGHRFDEGWWQPQLELGLLAGFLQFVCIRAAVLARSTDDSERRRHQMEMDWWAEQAEVAIQRLQMVENRQ